MPEGQSPDGQPPSDEPAKAAPRESVAPDLPQPDLVLKKLKDIMRDEQKTQQLIEETGMTRDELDQFVEKFDRPQDFGPSREGAEIEASPEQSDVNLDLNRRLSGGLPSGAVSSRSQRAPGQTPQDEAGGNTQGIRTVVPPQYSSRFEAYRSSLSGSRPPAPAAATTTNPPTRPGSRP